MKSRLVSLRPSYRFAAVLLLPALLALAVLPRCLPESRPAWSALSGPVARAGTNGEKLLALTFETLGEGRGTGRILAVLAEREVRATFFLEGRWASSHREETRAIAAAGHEIGSHSYAHRRSLSSLSADGQLADLARCGDLLRELTGASPAVFRPPYGLWSESLLASAASLGMETVLWDVDALDWREGSPQTICRTVIDSCGPGSILRFQQGGLSTPDALAPCLDALLAAGYRFVTVSELLAAGA